MSTEEPKVIVNIDNNSRIYQIVATLLAISAVGMLAYALAENGWLDIAATGLTMFMVQLIKLLFVNGLIRIPKGKGEFSESAGLLATLLKDFQRWQANSPIWRLALLAFGYTLAFMLARWAMRGALAVFTNIWVAGAFAALLGSIIIFPQLFSKAATRLKKATDK